MYIRIVGESSSGKVDGLETPPCLMFFKNAQVDFLLSSTIYRLKLKEIIIVKLPEEAVLHKENW